MKRFFLLSLFLLVPAISIAQPVAQPIDELINVLKAQAVSAVETAETLVNMRRWDPKSRSAPQIKAVYFAAMGAADENHEAYVAACRKLDEWSALNVHSLIEKFWREHDQEPDPQNIEETITCLRDCSLKLVQVVIDFRNRNTSAG